MDFDSYSTFPQNPLKLASDIVQADYEEVSEQYSEEIRALVNNMLNKVGGFFHIHNAVVNTQYRKPWFPLKW